LSFRRKPESGYFKSFWTPAFAGVTLQETFYETIKAEESLNNLDKKLSLCLNDFKCSGLILGRFGSTETPFARLVSSVANY
jgi:hypothetical protein